MENSQFDSGRGRDGGESYGGLVVAQLEWCPDEEVGDSEENHTSANCSCVRALCNRPTKARAKNQRIFDQFL
jgi:hypothetical protein